MGTGEASGPKRAHDAAEAAIQNPILDEVSLRGARGLLLSITGSRDLTLYEVDEAASRVRKEVDPEANIIVGATFDDALVDTIRVSIVATGVDQRGAAHPASGSAPAIGQARQQAAAEGDGLKRKLSDALRPREAGERQSAATVDQPLDLTQREELPAPQGGWVGPGDVTITDDIPRVLQGHAPPEPRPLAAPLDGGYQFEPMPPARVAGVERRMPELSDFPAIGQQAYRGKTAPTPHGSASAPMPPRRAGLLSRLGFSRSKASDESEPSDSPVESSRARSNRR